MSATLQRTHDTANDDTCTAIRHLLVIDDGGNTLRTGLSWAKHHSGPHDRITVLTAFSHLQVAPFAAECPVAVVEGLDDAEAAARSTAIEAVTEVFGSSEPGERVKVVAQAGYIHRLAQQHLCDATDVVIARAPSGRWPERLSPSPARRLAGRTARPLVIVPHDWMHTES